MNEMAKSLSLKILNTLEIAEGVWTRQQGDQKSTLDYLVVDEKEQDKVKSNLEVIENPDKETTSYLIILFALSIVSFVFFMFLKKRTIVDLINALNQKNRELA